MTKFLKRFFVIISDIISGGTNKRIAKHLKEIEERTKEFDRTIEDMRNKIKIMKEEMRRDMSSTENSIHVLKEKVINMTPEIRA